MREHTSYLQYAPEWFPPPTRSGGEEWPRQSDFARFVAVNTSPSEDYLGLLTPVTFSVLITMAVSHWNCPRQDISLWLCFKYIWIDAVRQLPGQDVPKQLSVWFRSPVHPNPPLAGAGFVQLLYRTFVPLPHDLLQQLQSDQDVKPPSTVKNWMKMLWHP